MIRNPQQSILVFILAVLIVSSCEERSQQNGPGSVNWKGRSVSATMLDSLVSGQTYLSIYSEIYSSTEQRRHSLTSTVSIRNTNNDDSVYIEKVEYYNTSGEMIRSYIEAPVFVAPMETIEIVISESDLSGGTGANFLFQWRTKDHTPEPLFEAVMISTSGQQGISFTTQGRRIK